MKIIFIILLNVFCICSLHNANACIPKPTYVNIGTLTNEVADEVEVRTKNPLIIRSRVSLSWEENPLVTIKKIPNTGFEKSFLYSITKKDRSGNTVETSITAETFGGRIIKFYIVLEKTPQHEKRRGMNKLVQSTHGCGEKAYIKYK